MISNIKSRKSMALTALSILGKLALLSLRIISSFASDKPSQSRYTTGKAQQLYEEGAITGSEYVRHIQGD